jgi:hypothetical protein
MEILENRTQWLQEFQAGWLAHFQETGLQDFKRYNRPKNSTPIPGPAVDLAQSRLLLVTSAGSYLPDCQQPYNAADPLGDYSIRSYASDTPLGDLAFAQDHYNHAAVMEDPQVLIPLDHLREMVNAGKIGALTPSVVSFHGYVPNAVRFVDETIPQIVAIAQQEQAQAALLVPA